MTMLWESESPLSQHISSLSDRITWASRRPATPGAAAADTVSLAVGEPFGPTPDRVTKAAITALHAGRTHYESFSGSPALRDRLARHINTQVGMTRDCPTTVVDADNVVVTHGGSAGLAATILTLVAPGDRVVLPEPTYSLYADQVAMAGGVVHWVPLNADGGLPLHHLADAAVGARLIILCNPGNPTGTIIPSTDIDAVIDITRSSGSHLLIDEAYAGLVYDGTQVPPAAATFDRANHVLCAGTFSKAWAMTGWRVGWIAAADPTLAARINLVHRTFNGPLSTFIQDAAIRALDLPEEYFTHLRSQFEKRRNITCEALDATPNLTFTRPQGAFYAFPRVHADLPAGQLVTRLAQAGVAVRDGAEFGPSGVGHVRLSFATSIEDLQHGLRRFRAVLTAL
jgi:aspartate aminotransferase